MFVEAVFFDDDKRDSICYFKELDAFSDATFGTGVHSILLVLFDVKSAGYENESIAESIADVSIICY